MCHHALPPELFTMSSTMRNIVSSTSASMNRLLMEVERKVESRHDLAKQCGKANLLLGCEVSRSARTADEERR